MWNQANEYNKKESHSQRTNLWLSVRRRKRGGAIWVVDKEVQTTTYKISHEDVSHNMGNIASIL